MKKLIRTLGITVILSVFMALNVFAENPNFTISFGDEVFNLEDANNPEKFKEIKQDIISENGGKFEINTLEGTYTASVNDMDNNIEILNFNASKNKTQYSETNANTSIVEDDGFIYSDVKAAIVGSSIYISLTNKGQKDYKQAVKYQVYDGNKPVSAIANLESRTIVFPAMVNGDKINIKLFNTSDNEIVIINNVTLGVNEITRTSISGSVSLPDGEAAPKGGIDVEIYPIDIEINNEVNWLRCKTFHINEGENSVDYSLQVESNNMYIFNYQLNDKNLQYVQRGFYSKDSIKRNTFDAEKIDVTEQDIANIDMQIEYAKTIYGKISLPEKVDAENRLSIKLNCWIDLGDSDGLMDTDWVTLNEGEDSAEYILKVKPNEKYVLSYTIYKDGSEVICGYYNGNGTVLRWRDAERIEVKDKDIYGVNILVPDYEDGKINIEVVSKPDSVNVGDSAKITLRAINNSNENKNATLIIGLFDEDNKFINYSSASQQIEAHESVELTGLLKVLPEGYKVKCFVWDTLGNMMPLSEVIEIPVEKNK